MLNRLLTRLLYYYIRFTYLTNQWQWVNAEAHKALLSAGKPIILALWHGRLAMIANSWSPDYPQVNLMISHHKDGQIITDVMTYFNFAFLRGSTGKKGALGAFREGLRVLNKGECVALTPDGPRGPRMRVTGGIIDMASRTGVPIVPVTFSSSRAKRFNSWDRFHLPLPFGKSCFIYGNLLEVPRTLTDGEKEQWRKKLEDELLRITYDADTLCGIDTVDPA
jgi:lysophospholipid acyltransferase (LPLAT)-like uncharacterized protein